MVYNMKIGIVVHGPNIIDSGYALKIINILGDFGEVHCRLGGTMGRTAVIDASLENLIDISAKRLPSDSVKLFFKENVDVIVLLNYGKSSITGHTFGFKVFKNSFFDDSVKNEIKNKSFDFIQIERPGEDDGNVIHWIGTNSNNSTNNLTIKLASLLNLNILEPEKIINNYFKEDLNTFMEFSSDNSIEIDNDIIEAYKKHGIVSDNDKNDLNKNNIEKIRKIHGVSPDENIFVNGVVIGKSNSENLALVSKNGEIIDIIGGTIKDHGIEKLGPVDIDKAIVKTGLLRKSNPKPRIISKFDNIGVKSFNFDEINVKNEYKSDNGEKEDVQDINNYLNVVFIDHAAEDIYNLKNFDLAVTIGDDTTLLASDILYRFNIPVIGITDGDLDKVVEKGYIAEESTIIELMPGFDDIVGKSIFKNLFNSQYYLKIPIKTDEENNFKNNNDIRNIKSKIFEDFKNELFKIVNNITTEYQIK